MARQFDRAPNKRTSLGNEERKSYSSQYLKAGYSSNCPNVPRSLKQQRVSIWHQNLHSLIFTIPLIHHSSVCDAGDILPPMGRCSQCSEVQRFQSSILSRTRMCQNFPGAMESISEINTIPPAASRGYQFYIKHQPHSGKYIAFSVTDYDTLEIAARGNTSVK